MKKLIHCAYSILILLTLTGCGTVSNLNSPESKKSPDLKRFDHIIVYDFTTTITIPEKSTELKHAINFATRDFPDKIARRIEANLIFKSVSRSGEGDENTVFLSGNITKYEEGNTLGRMLIGLGVGSSYFDAEIKLRNKDNILLGTILVDKNSWVLGGGIASGQTVDVFMEEAAAKVVQQLAVSKGEKLKKNVAAPSLGKEFKADEAKTLAWLSCTRPYALTQDCSGMVGAKKKVIIADYALKIAGSKDGHQVLIMCPDIMWSGASDKFLSVFDDIKAILEKSSIKILKTMKYTTWGKVGAVTIDLDGDGYSVLLQYEPKEK